MIHVTRRNIATDEPEAVTGCPHYPVVPKKWSGNVRFRAKLMEQADEDMQDDLRRMCAEDILFYINAFVMTFDPFGRGPGKSRHLPFITYPFQDEAICALRDAVGNHDIGIKKSRDMGATWMLLVVFDWFWRFHDSRMFILVSRNKDYVDSRDSKSLFWKLDYIESKLPSFLKIEERGRKYMTLVNPVTRSQINGETTTGNLGRGGRFDAIGIDEFAAFDLNAGFAALAATQNATPCRIFNSTPQGVGNAFSEVMENPDMRKLTMHWSADPRKNEGLYHKDGKPRSPWYDAECKRSPSQRHIAQELDIDFQASDYQFFDEAMVATLLGRCRPPDVSGDLDYDRQTMRHASYMSGPGGLRLWINPAGSKMPSDRVYVIGVDVSQGTGATPSVASVGDCLAGARVAEFADAHRRPEQFAEDVIAMAHWFTGSDGRPALVIWESNGPGRQFGARLMEMGFRNVWFHSNEQKLHARRTDIPGFGTTPHTKMVMVSEYRRALYEQLLLNPDELAVKELRQMIWIQSRNTVDSARGTRTSDPSAARENHADRVIADALMWKGMKHRGVAGLRDKQNDPQAPPPGSLAERMQMARDHEQKSKRRWTNSRIVRPRRAV